MTVQEKVGAITFVVACGAVWFSAGVVVLGWLVRKIRRRPATTVSRPRRIARVVVLAAALFGVGCVTWGYFVEPYWVELTYVEIVSPKLSGLDRPVRIAHISDLHCDPKRRAEDAVVKAVRQAKPDLIVFTGDAFNSPAGAENFRDVMRKLAAIAPTYASRGNWDHMPTSFFEKLGVRFLDGGDSETVTVAGQTFVLTGVLTALAPPTGPDGAYRIVLSHFPGLCEQLAPLGYDLQLSGHTHGGQIALPGYGAIIAMDRFGKRYEAGRYEVGDMALYVSRGVGMEGKVAPRVRFWARPEVTVLELASPR